MQKEQTFVLVVYMKICCRNFDSTSQTYLENLPLSETFLQLFDQSLPIQKHYLNDSIQFVYAWSHLIHPNHIFIRLGYIMWCKFRIFPAAAMHDNTSNGSPL